MADRLSSHLKGGQQLLPPMESIATLSPLVTTALGCNPSSFSLQGTNTYLVGRGPRKILIDSGEGRPEYLDTLSKAMESCGCTGIEQILITHWHHDHLGGVPSIQERFGPDIPVRKFMPMGQESLSSGEGAIDPYAIWARERFEPLQDGETVRTQGASLRVIFTPGHANDHVSLVLEEEGSIFTADNVLGVGTAVFSDLGLYLNSLGKMKEAALQLSRPQVRFYTGHGAHIEDGVATLDDYVQHRTFSQHQLCLTLTLQLILQIHLHPGPSLPHSLIPSQRAY